MKVAGSHLEAPSPSFVNANKENEAITLIYEREGVCSVTEGIEKNYLGRFIDGANWRQLLFWLGKFYTKPWPPVRRIFHPHSISAA